MAYNSDWTRTVARKYDRFDEIPAEETDIRLTWILLWEEGRIDSAVTEEESEALRAFREPFVLIPSFDTHEEYRDMEQFAMTVRNPDLAERLERALGGRGSFRRFKDALYAFPAERERWFDFQTERRRQRIDDWLESVEPEPAGEEEASTQASDKP